MPRRDGLGIFGKSQTERFGAFLSLDFGRVTSNGGLKGEHSPALDDMSARKGRRLARDEKNGKGSFGELHDCRRCGRDDDLLSEVCGFFVEASGTCRKTPHKKQIDGRRNGLSMMH